MTIEVGGIPLGTPFQGGTLIGVTALVGIAIRAVMILARAYIDGIPARGKVSADREANLLHERAEEMASMRERLAAVEAKLDSKDKQLDVKDRLIAAERQIYRHRISNLSGAFGALLMLLKKGVAVDEAVEEIERLRESQLSREVAEAARFRAAGLDIDVSDPFKSEALLNAEDTARDTKQADLTAQNAVDVIRREEASQPK